MRRVVSTLAATAHCLPRRAVSFHFESTLGWRAVTRRHQRTLTRLGAPRGVLLAQQAHAQLTALTSSQKLSSRGLSTWRSCCAMFMLGARPFSGHHADNRSVGVPCTTGLQAFAWSTRAHWPQNTCTSRVLHSSHAAVTCTITKRGDAPSKAHAPTSAGTCRAAHHMQPQTCTY